MVFISLFRGDTWVSNKWKKGDNWLAQFHLENGNKLVCEYVCTLKLNQNGSTIRPAYKTESYNRQ